MNRLISDFFVNINGLLYAMSASHSKKLFSSIGPMYRNCYEAVDSFTYLSKPAVIPSGAFKVNSSNQKMRLKKKKESGHHHVLPLYSVIKRFKAVDPAVRLAYII
jgi:hypothetical protein